MSKSSSISNVSISQTSSGGNYQNQETPVLNSGPVVNGSISLTVVLPFHSNVSSSVNPTIIPSVINGKNTIIIKPFFDLKMSPGNLYSQLTEINFQINDAALHKGSITIDVVIDEDDQPISNSNSNRLRAPKRKTVIIVDSGD